MFQDLATDWAYFVRRAEEERAKAAASDHPGVMLVHLQMAEEYIRRAVSLSQITGSALRFTSVACLSSSPDAVYCPDPNRVGSYASGRHIVPPLSGSPNAAQSKPAEGSITNR